MPSNSVPMEISFTHIVLEGTPYKVGRQQEDLKKDKQRANYLTPTLPFLDGYSQCEAQRALDYIEKYCPGLREEIQGAADGFGKTTLVTDWLRSLTRRIAWLCVDEDDNDPKRFCTYLIAALRQIGEGIGHGRPGPVERSPAATRRSVGDPAAARPASGL